jgi:hypothetical protein
MTYRNYSLAQLQQADAAHHLHPLPIIANCARLVHA